MIYFQHMDLQGPDLHHAWRAVTGPDVHHEWRAVAVELVAEIHEVKADSIYRIFYIRHVAQGTRVVRLTTTRTVHGTLDYAQGLVRRRGTGSTRSVCVARVERQQRRAKVGLLRFRLRSDCVGNPYLALDCELYPEDEPPDPYPEPKP